MLALNVAAADTPGLVWQSALIAWILSVPLYFVTKFVLVIAHEGGHAIVGIALFNGIKRIIFNKQGGGETQFAGDLTWPFVILVAFAGYAGPSLFGLMAAWLLLHGQPEMVVWGSMAFLVATFRIVGFCSADRHQRGAGLGRLDAAADAQLTERQPGG